MLCTCDALQTPCVMSEGQQRGSCQPCTWKRPLSSIMTPKVRETLSMISFFALFFFLRMQNTSFPDAAGPHIASTCRVVTRRSWQNLHC